MQPVSRAVHDGRSTRSFDLRYQPHAQNTGEGEREVEEDDLTTAFYENDEIDLGQLMREQFYLALPMKPLCREDCRGAVPGVRDESEPRDVRLRAATGKIRGSRR